MIHLMHEALEQRALRARRVAPVLLAALLVCAPSGRSEDKPERHGVLAPPTAGPDIRTPPMTDGVLKALEAPYLKEDERAALRVFHGVWTDSDLASPRLRARAALIAGVYDDLSLANTAADVEDRAEAMLIRGEAEPALSLLAGAASARAVRVRAEALEALGRMDEADAAVDPLVALLTRQSASASDITEGVRALRVRGRIRGQAPGDYGRMIQLLSHAQENLDRLYWPAVLEQAEILGDKDNGADAEKALRQALSMNPSSARAWRMLGEMSVDGFSFDATEKIAGRLRTIGSRFATGASESADAAFILTRARLRQNAPDDAERELSRALERFPRHPEALALSAACAAARFDYPLLESRLGALDSLWSPPPIEGTGPWRGLLLVARVLSEKRQYDRAADYFRRAAGRAPFLPDPLIDLGLLEVQAGRDAEARDVLKRAVEMDPFHTRALNSRTLVEEITRYSAIESANFIVRCRPGVDEVIAREMVAPLEQIHALVCATFEHTPAQRTIIELMPNHEWFAVRVTGMPGVHTIAASTGPVIAMEAPREGQGHFGVYDWERVIRHEFTHTVNLSQTGYRIPHWFTEAAAVSLELAPYDYGTCQLLVSVLIRDELFDLREINEAFVRPKRPTDRQQAYMQGNWMYRYIVDTWGRGAPVRLMERFALGEREEKAFPAVLSVTTSEFVTGFTQWAKKDAASWGMLPVPSLDELRLKWMLSQDAERAGLGAGLRRAGLASAALIAGNARSEKPSSMLGFDLAPPTPELVEQWSRDWPDHPDLLELKMTDALAASGGEVTPELVPLLERYAAARPADPAPHRHLARYYLSTEDPARSIPHLEYLDIREQYSPAFASALARQYAAAGDLDRAWTKAERATRIAGYDAELREQAATIALRRGRPADAQRHIEALVALEPDQEIHRRRLEAVKKKVEAGGA